eukprot:5533654-Pleurochrysis_carterae.AAC.2
MFNPHFNPRDAKSGTMHDNSDNDTQRKDKDSSDEDDADDDPPRVAPPAYVLDEDAADTAPVVDFLLWTVVDSGKAAWHHGKVVNTLEPGRKDDLTHDARLAGIASKNRARRGASLTPELRQQGMWQHLQRITTR